MEQAEQKTSYRWQILSSFWLKIIAIITMTMDHIGAAMQTFCPWNTTAIQFLRSCGRLALPLFAFMIVEGVLHTHSFKKYLFRLGVTAFLISVALCVFEYVPNADLNDFAGEGNIFLDLVLGAWMIYALNQENKWKKLFALIPIGIAVLNFVIASYEAAPLNHVVWYPLFLRMQYNIYSVALILGFYIAKKMAPLFLETFYQVPEGTFDKSGKLALFENIFAVVSLVSVTMLYYAIHFINASIVTWDYRMQNYAMLSSLAILFYNGKSGYHKTWFKYGCYVYYPVHIVVIILIFVLIYGY